MKIYLNGQIVDEKEAKISVFDRGYLFGEGLFETIRSYRGELPFLDKHFNRMEWGATFVGIPFPHPRQIREAILSTLKANELKDARIKILLSGVNQSGFRPLIPTEKMEMNLVVGCEKLIHLPDSDYEEGVALTILCSVTNDPPPGANIKSMSWLTKTIARRELMEKDCYDGILLDAQGCVTETTTANLFWIFNESIYTAPTSIGLLPGVTRGIVIDLVKEEGLKFQERLIKPEELVKADEIFLTGSTLEIMPVSTIDSQTIGSDACGKITRLLQQRYRERIEEEIRDS